MKRLSLGPYPGTLLLFDRVPDFVREYEKRAGRKNDHPINPRGGRMSRLTKKFPKDTVYLVYGRRPSVLAHEFCHVLFDLFDAIGYKANPVEDEPYCYMLTWLMNQATAS